MKCFRLLLTCAVHLAIVIAMTYLIVYRNETVWGGTIMLFTLGSLCITLNSELDRNDN